MDGRLHFVASIENSGAINGLNEIQAAMRQTAQQAERSGTDIDQMFQKIKNAAAMTVAGYSLQQIASTLANVRGKYQQYQMALETMLGSADKAAQKMQEFAKLAAITPFGMDDVVSGAKQLMAYGIEADKVTDTMRRLGDVAAGLGLNLNDLAWLYGTTATQGKLFTQDFRQFTGRGIPLADELAKQFGVTKDKVQDLVSAGKVGFPEVEKAIISMTDAGGKFGGLMENQSKSITGRISNIEDTIEQAINEIGTSTEGVMYTALDGVTLVVEHWKEVGEAILAAAEAIGLYKAATVGIAAYQKASTNIGYDAQIKEFEELVTARNKAHVDELTAKDLAGTLSADEQAELAAMKKQAANADLEEAVASGRLTEAKAAQVAAMREEAAAYVEELQLKAQVAAADLSTKAQDVTNAEALVAKRKEELDIAVSANTEATNALALAESNKKAADDKVSAAQEYLDLLKESVEEGGDDGEVGGVIDTAAVELKAAVEEQLAAATELETAAEEANTTAQAVNTAETNLNTATTELNAASEAKATATTTAETASKQANTAAQQLNAAATAKDTVAKGLWAQVVALCKKAQDAWNASMLSSPLFWIAAAIAAATYGIYKLATAESEEEAARRKSNEAWDEFNNKLEERKNKITSLICTIQDSTATEYARAEAYSSLAAIAPELTDKYTQAELAALAFSKAQGDINESMDAAKFEEAKKNIEDYKEEVADLNGKQDFVNDFTDGQYGLLGLVGKASTAVIGHFKEQAEAAVQEAENVYDKMFEIQRQARENARPIEVRLKEAEDNQTVRQAVLDFYDEAMVLAADWQKANETINYATGETRLDEFIKKAQKELDDLRKKQEDNPLDVKLQMEAEEKQKILDGILSWKSNAEARGDTTIPFLFKADFNSAKQALEQAKNIFQGLQRSPDTKTYAEDYAAAQKEWNARKAALAKITKNKSAYSSKDYEEAVAAEKTARDAFAKLGGDTSTKTTAKGNKSTGKNLADERKKAQEQLAKELLDLQQKNQDEEISLMREGTAKKLAEIKRDYDKRKAEIDKQEKEFKEKNKTAKAKTNADGLTTEQSEALSAARGNAEEKYDKDTSKVRLEAYKAEAEAMRGYIKEYGTFQQQKLALAQEYAAKIKEVNESAEYSDNEKAWRVRTLEKEQAKATDEVEANAVMARIDWYQVFGNVGGIMTEAMRPLLEDLKAFARTDKFQNLGADQQKAIVEAIGNLRSQIGDNSDVGWRDLAKAVTEYQSALQEATVATHEYEALELELAPEIEEAQKKLDKALKENDTVATQAAQEELDSFAARLADCGEKVTEANTKIATSGTQLAQTTQAVREPIDEIHNFLSSAGLSDLQAVWDGFLNLKGAIDGLKALEHVGDAAGDIGKSTGKIGEALDNTAEAVADATADAADGLTKVLSKGGWIAGIISSILSILNAIGEGGLGTLVSAIIQRVLEAVDGIIENILSGKFIEQIVGAIIRGVGNILNTIIGHIGSFISGGLLSSGGPAEWFNNSNAKEVAETSERLAEENELLRKSVDNLKDEMANQGGEKLLETGQNALNKENRVIKNLQADIANQSSYHGDHHSWGSYWNDRGGFSAEEKAYFSKVVGHDWNGDIYNMTAEEAEKLVLDERFRNIITGTGKSYYGRSVLEKIEALAEEAGEIDDILDSIREGLTQTTFNDLRSSFMDTLMDMDASAEDFADDFSEYMMRAMLNAQLAEMLDDQLEAFYKKWAEYAEDGLDENELADLQGDWDAIVQKGLEIRDQAAAVTGYGSSSVADAQSTTVSTTMSITEDTAKALEGRMTAIQYSNEQIRNSVIQQVEMLTTISTVGMAQSKTLNDILVQTALGNGYLEDVVKYTKAMYTDFTAKLDKANKQLEKL